MFHHEDSIRLQDGREPVGDDDGGALMQQAFERLLHQRFAFGVERRGCLVEQQDRRIAQDGAGNGDALALAAGKRHAAFTHLGIISIGETFDEAVSLCGDGGGAHLLACRVRSAKGDIVVDGGGEYRHILRNDGQARAQIGEGDVADIRAIDGDAALLRIVKAHQQRKDRALART
ncbi:hypothetical protein D3C86_1256330 [compost metagenome]